MRDEAFKILDLKSSDYEITKVEENSCENSYEFGRVVWGSNFYYFIMFFIFNYYNYYNYL